MRLAIPNTDELQPAVARALDALRHQISTSFQQAHDADGHRVRFVLVAFHNTTQQLADATWTAVTFNSEEDLRGVSGVSRVVGAHDKSTRSDRFLVPEGYAGRVRVRSTIVFDTNATGSRGVRVMKNGAVVRGGAVFVAAATAISQTALQVVWTGTLVVGDELTIEAYQNSGGNLDIGGTTDGVINSIDLEFL